MQASSFSLAFPSMSTVSLVTVFSGFAVQVPVLPLLDGCQAVNQHGTARPPSAAVTAPGATAPPPTAPTQAQELPAQTAWKVKDTLKVMPLTFSHGPNC